VGPESFRFEELIRLIAHAVGRRVRLVHIPATMAYVATLVTGWMMRDVVLTWEEYQGLMSNLLAREGPAAGPTRLTDWLAANRASVGTAYASEVGRHYSSGKESQ
jgi:NADH dehydrogenase